jgi:hypothetical protein
LSCTETDGPRAARPGPKVPNVGVDNFFAGFVVATLAGMPAGSHVRAIALNIGDTSASDTGLAGYLDNVRIATGSGTTTYDFDVNPGTKDDCKSGGWALYGFANQGGCVSWVQANPHAGK